MRREAEVRDRLVGRRTVLQRSVDPDLVPGVLFSTVRLADGEAGVADVYPTVRSLMGLAPGKDLDGRAFAEAGK